MLLALSSVLTIFSAAKLILYKSQIVFAQRRWRGTKGITLQSLSFPPLLPPKSLLPRKGTVEERYNYERHNQGGALPRNGRPSLNHLLYLFLSFDDMDAV